MKDQCCWQSAKEYTEIDKANFSSMEMTALFIGTLQLKISGSLHFAVL